MKEPKQIERETAKAGSAALQDQFNRVRFVDPKAVANLFEQRK
jgi:hypothetical protein